MLKNNNPETTYSSAAPASSPLGGRRFYAMVSPDGQERWSIQKYTSITPKTNFKMFSAFADKDENPELPGSNWDYTFKEEEGRTTVSIVIYNESLARMERMIEMASQKDLRCR